MSDTYGFAPPDPPPVTSAAGCSTAMTGEKKAAVKAYLGKVGPELRRRHGKRDHYEPEQVRGAVLATGGSVDWVCWAFLLYCSPPVFHDLHVAAGEVCDRDGMWSAVAGTFFSGNTAFDPLAVSDVILSGAAGVADLADVADAAASGAGWLADIDWGGLLDWS